MYHVLNVAILGCEMGWYGGRKPVSQTEGKCFDICLWHTTRSAGNSTYIPLQNLWGIVYYEVEYSVELVDNLMNDAEIHTCFFK